MSVSENDFAIRQLMELIFDVEGLEDELITRLINKYQHNPNIANEEDREAVRSDLLHIVGVYGGIDELDTYFSLYPETDSFEDLEEAFIYIHDYGRPDNVEYIVAKMQERRSPVTTMSPTEALLLTDEELEMQL